jgi:predicted esterase
MREQSIATTIHGRYLAVAAAAPGPAPLLVGFHGYGEDAEAQLVRMRAVPYSGGWHIVSIQGLHRFYERRSNRVVASWMTRQDREAAIADNIAYVKACIAQERSKAPAIVFAGFSQGVAMAFRAAVSVGATRTGVIAVGGDVPPEIDIAALRKISAALIVRGSEDEWYNATQFAEDRKRLAEAGVAVRSITLNCGHGWSPDLGPAAAEFLAELAV